MTTGLLAESETEMGTVADTKPQYGIDAPIVVGVFGVASLVFLVVAVAFLVASGAGAAIGPFIAALLTGGACAAMIVTSTRWKPALWHRQLDALELRGDERALDVGCGRGLVAIELAARLPRGSVAAVDIWRPRDLSGNSQSAAEDNIAAAGVADRIEVLHGDMLELPYGDDEFDVVTASIALRVLPLADQRGSAMKEIMRVTRPGGRIVIADNARIFEYEAWVRDSGWEDIDRSWSYASYPPIRVLTATKPRRSASKGTKGSKNSRNPKK